MRYWPLAILVLFVGAIIGISQHVYSDRQSHDEQTRQAKAVTDTESVEAKANDALESTYKPHIWARYFSWPEGVGAWAVILTLIVIAWQSIETRAAAMATEKSAIGVERQSALIERQIQIGIDKDRARLHVDASSFKSASPNAFATGLEIRNFGQSNAHILHSRGKLILAERTDRFSPTTISDAEDFPALDIASKLIPPTSEPVYATFWHEVDEDQLKHFADDIETGHITLHLCGFVEYETLKTSWHRDFWYKWTLENPRESASAIMTGFAAPQSDVERITDGYWKPTPKQNNNEYQLAT